MTNTFVNDVATSALYSITIVALASCGLEAFDITLTVNEPISMSTTQLTSSCSTTFVWNSLSHPLLSSSVI
jgi:hypothetical protein